MSPEALCERQPPALVSTSGATAQLPAAAALAAGQPTAQCTLAAGPSKAAWWQVLTSLSLRESSAPIEADWLKRVLADALASVRDDEQWNCSGIPELLLRATELAERGHLQSSLAKAISLLDFHLLVEKYRSVVTRSGSSQSASGSAGAKRSGDDSTAVEVQSPGPSAKKQRLDSDAAGASPTSSGDNQQEAVAATAPAPSANDNAFAKPTHRSSSALARSQAASATTTTTSTGSAPSSDAGCRALHSSQESRRRSTARPMAHPHTWTGNVTQDVHGRTVVYCGVSLDVPREHAHEFKRELEVSHLAPRKGVKLGEHYVCKASIAGLSRSQTAKLRSLAQHELVLVVPLSDNGIILVPYLDSAGSVKLVGFFVLV